MQPIFKNTYSDFKLVRLNIIIIIILCLYLFFKYINTQFNLKNIEKLDRLIPIDILEKNIIENIKLYLNYISISLLNTHEINTVSEKLDILAKQESIIDIINKQFEIELSIKQGRTPDEKLQLNNINGIFNDCKQIIQTITKNIKQLQEYITILYNPEQTLNIKNMIIERDTLFIKTNNLIKNFIDINTITQNDDNYIKQLKQLINDMLLRIQLEKLSYYNINKLIETNIEQIKKYDEQINANPPLQNVNTIKLLRINLYNKINNIVNIEITNRSNDNLNKAAFNSYNDILLSLKKE